MIPFQANLFWVVSSYSCRPSVNQTHASGQGLSDSEPYTRPGDHGNQLRAEAPNGNEWAKWKTQWIWLSGNRSEFLCSDMSQMKDTQCGIGWSELSTDDVMGHGLCVDSGLICLGIIVRISLRAGLAG